MTIITTKQFPARFPNQDVLIAEAERRTEFILASNPDHINPAILDDILDDLLGTEWRQRELPHEAAPEIETMCAVPSGSIHSRRQP